MFKCDSTSSRAKLCPISIGVALGITKGLGFFLLGLSAMQYGYGIPLVDMLSSLYPGFAATVVGSFKGAAWGLFDGFICGVIFAWIYNLCVCCCRNCVAKKDGM